jgi:uncharacterized protein (TIGR04255 family)
MANKPVLPLQGAAPKEIALPNAPLVSVIAQVRFPTRLAVRSADRIIGFQDLICAHYPHLERQDISSFILGPGPSPTAGGESSVHWRFSDDTHKWRVTLTQDFIALETNAYESRTDFLERLKIILQAFEETFTPAHMTRFGMRYIDQIKGEPLTRIATLLRDEVIGVANSLGASAKQVLTQIEVAAEPGDLVARWGKLPANMTFDPNLVPAIGEDSWFIDLDVSKSGESPFLTEAIIETATLCAERVYAVFRWMVTKDFLRTYGGGS